MTNFFDDTQGEDGGEKPNTVGSILRAIASTAGVQLYQPVHCPQCRYTGNHLISKRNPKVGTTCPTCQSTLVIEKDT